MKQIDDIPAECKQVLSSENLDLLSRDACVARGLPNFVFTSETFLSLERQHLFPKCWVFVGRASMIPNPGDKEIVEVSGQPLVLIRDKDSKVQVFHNVCPHRGARIVPEGAQGSRTITCPYHSWTFHLDGSLAARPHFDGPGQHDHALKECQVAGEIPHLFKVRCAQWFDWIFVDLDGKALPFEDVCRPAMEKLAPYPLNHFRFEAVEEFEFACNWKLVLENWIDMYHIFKVHPDLNSFMEPQAQVGMSVDNAFIYNQYAMTRPSRAVGLESAPGTQGVEGLVTFGMLFPAVGITVDATNVLFANFTPIAPDRTKMEMLFYFPEATTDSEKDQEAREQYRKWWVELNREDEEVCRLLQLGRQSPAYDGGRFAPYWDQATLHFQRLIIETMKHGATPSK